MPEDDTGPRRSRADFAPSLYFDASVHYGRDNATPEDRVRRSRVDAIRAAVVGIPVVTYRVVGRGENERAHKLARAGHR